MLRAACQSMRVTGCRSRARSRRMGCAERVFAGIWALAERALARGVDRKLKGIRAYLFVCRPCNAQWLAAQLAGLCMLDAQAMMGEKVVQS